jgi:hypothetical protein
MTPHIGPNTTFVCDLQARSGGRPSYGRCTYSAHPHPRSRTTSSPAVNRGVPRINASHQRLASAPRICASHLRLALAHARTRALALAHSRTRAAHSHCAWRARFAPTTEHGARGSRRRPSMARAVRADDRAWRARFAPTTEHGARGSRRRPTARHRCPRDVKRQYCVCDISRTYSRPPPAGRGLVRVTPSRRSIARCTDFARAPLRDHRFGAPVVAEPAHGPRAILRRADRRTRAAYPP